MMEEPLFLPRASQTLQRTKHKDLACYSTNAPVVGVVVNGFFPNVEGMELVKIFTKGDQ
jgi:hypothetical protein